MRTILPFVIALVCLSATKKQKVIKDFTVIRAEAQTFFGGVAGSPVTTTYTMIVKANKSFVVSIDSGWAKNQADQAVILLDSGKTTQKKKVKKGEILHLVVQIKTASNMGGGDNQWQIPGSVESISPCGVKNYLCIRYQGYKLNYLTTKTIKTLPAILGQ